MPPICNGHLKQLKTAEITLLREKSHLEKVDAFAGIPDSLLAEEKSLQSDIVFYRNKLKDLQADSSKILRWQNILIEKNRKKDELLKRFEQEYPRYYQLKHELPAHAIPQLQQELGKQKACLLSYFRNEDQLYLFVIDKQASRLIQQKLPAAFDSLVNAYMQQITQLHSLEDPQDAYRDFCGTSFQLYQLLLEPASDQIADFQRLLIIPDGILGYLPFESFITQEISDFGQPNYQQLPYLIRQCEIGYSYHFHQTGKKKRSRPLQYMAFAPNFGLASAGDSMRRSLPSLRFAQGELQALAQHFDGLSLEGTDARESAFKEHAGAYSILHFSTHSWFQDEGNLDPYLIFSPENERNEDGFLHSYELYNVSLESSMAVLSACNTGVGSLQQGEGIMSMAHAFAYAGCPGIIMSLWQVNDHTTSQLIQHFYHGIAENKRKSEALRDAKLAFLEDADPVRAHPYFWAGMVSIGDQSPLRESKASIGLLGILLTLMVAGGIFWYLQQKK